MKLIVYTDGASRGNPGHASYGFTISNENGKLIYQEGKYIGITTNNVAEYKAVLEALKYVRKIFSSIPVKIDFYMDSKLVVEQLSGRFKIKSPHLKELVEKIRILTSELGSMVFTHVKRSENTQADKLANMALDRLI